MLEFRESVKRRVAEQTRSRKEVERQEQARMVSSSGWPLKIESVRLQQAEVEAQIERELAAEAELERIVATAGAPPTWSPTASRKTSSSKLDQEIAQVFSSLRASAAQPFAPSRLSARCSTRDPLCWRSVKTQTLVWPRLAGRRWRAHSICGRSSPSKKTRSNRSSPKRSRDARAQRKTTCSRRSRCPRRRYR